MMELNMTMLTHTPGLQALHEGATASRVLDGASHVAALKRFAKFVMGLAVIVLVVATVVGVKLAVFFPRFVQ
jgi:hypothetical protein